MTQCWVKVDGRKKGILWAFPSLEAIVLMDGKFKPVGLERLEFVCCLDGSLGELGVDKAPGWTTDG